MGQTLIRADLHNHFSSSPFKGDSEEVVQIARARLGKGGILGVCDFGYPGFENVYRTFIENLSKRSRVSQIGDFAAYLPEKDLYLLRGIEVDTSQGHLLILGTSPDVVFDSKGDNSKKLVSLEDNLGRAKENKGIVILEHPELISNLDAIEVHNGESGLWIPGLLPRNANSLARNYYKQVFQEKGLGAISSSDGHSLDEIGRNYTLLSSLEICSLVSPEQFRESLRDSIRNARLKDTTKNCSYGEEVKHAIRESLLRASVLYKNLGR